MASLTDTELVRARWRRHLCAEALDTTERDDFAFRGLGARVPHLAFRLLLLPYDPDRELPEAKDVAAHLESHRSLDIGNGTIHFGTRVTPAAHATALVVRPGDNEPWERFVAVHRNGAIELGLNDRERRYSDDPDTKFVQLVAAASFSWATLELARGFNPGSNHVAHLLAVALPDTAGARLNNLANGYSELGSHYGLVPVCPDRHLLWPIELDRLPTEAEETYALALNIAHRVVGAWGVTSTWHLDQEGSSAGQLSVHRAHQWQLEPRVSRYASVKNRRRDHPRERRCSRSARIASAQPHEYR